MDGFITAMAGKAVFDETGMIGRLHITIRLPSILLELERIPPLKIFAYGENT